MKGFIQGPVSGQVGAEASPAFMPSSGLYPKTQSGRICPSQAALLWQGSEQGQEDSQCPGSNGLGRAAKGSPGAYRLALGSRGTGKMQLLGADRSHLAEQRLLSEGGNKEALVGVLRKALCRCQAQHIWRSLLPQQRSCQSRTPELHTAGCECIMGLIQFAL